MEKKVQSAFGRQVGPMAQAELEHCRGHASSPQQSQQQCLLPEQSWGLWPGSAQGTQISTACLSALGHCTDQPTDIEKGSGGAEIRIIHD